MCYSVSPPKKQEVLQIFGWTNFVSLKFLREQLSIPTDNSVVVTRWLLLINSQNMAKSAIHKLLTEILYGIKKLIYIRFIDKH